MLSEGAQISRYRRHQPGRGLEEVGGDGLSFVGKNGSSAGSWRKEGENSLAGRKAGRCLPVLTLWSSQTAEYR